MEPLKRRLRPKFCKKRGCTIKLSTYNLGKFCFNHNLLEQIAEDRAEEHQRWLTNRYYFQKAKEKRRNGEA